jgi:hypothetical protein
MTQTVTLTEVLKEQAAQLQAATDAATATSKQVTADQSTAQQAVTADQAVLAQLGAEASVLHQQLAAATMEADQRAFELRLYGNLGQQRDAQIKLAADQDELAGLTQQSQALAGQITALQGALARANSDLGIAQQQDAAAANDRTTLTTTVAGAVQEAGSDQVKALVTDASDALAKLVGGANMVDVLRSRCDDAQAIIGDQQGAAARAQLAGLAVTQLSSPNAAAVAAAAAQSDDARTSAHRWATEGPGGLAAARQALQRTIGTAAFSPAVSKDIGDRATAATDSGAAAADKAFHDAAVASIAADAALDAVTGPKAAVDPGYDPAKDDTVKAQRDAAAAADKARTAADTARTPDFKQQMADWGLSLPPDAITLAIATFGAQAQIAALAALDIAALLAGLDAAETAYAEALTEQAKINMLQQAAAEKQAYRAADAARYAAGADQRVLAVVRGDL